jgi:hypothetical protein
VKFGGASSAAGLKGGGVIRQGVDTVVAEELAMGGGGSLVALADEVVVIGADMQRPLELRCPRMTARARGRVNNGRLDMVRNRSRYGERLEERAENVGSRNHKLVLSHAYDLSTSVSPLHLYAPSEKL